tara:strand:+ start:3529 stop:4848 length:1320 start_codon:yes stop_codon:yes gene_type:complete
MSASAEVAGKKGACPECQAVMEIPVASLEGKLADIHDGKCVVLILKAEYYQAEKGEYYRFRCRICDHGLSIPADKGHKKIQCTNCKTISRLSLSVLKFDNPLQIKEQAKLASQSNHPGGVDNTVVTEDPDKIQFECKDCRQAVRVPKEHAGKKGRCPNCQATVEIPYYSTITGFRVKQSVFQSSVNPLTTVNVNLPGADLLKNYVPESPLKAGPWTPPKSSHSTRSATSKRPVVKRDGFPWENPPESGGRFWPTCKMILFSPNTAFQQMYEDDGLGNPIGFAVIGHLIATILFAIAMLPVLLVACVLATPHMANGVDYSALAQLFAVGIAIWFGAGLLLIPLLMFCYGAVLHAAVFIVGGSDKPFATTNRMLAYSFGANLQTLAVPFLGPILFLIFWCIQMCCGLSKTHEKSMGQAFLAFLVATLTPAFFIGLTLMMTR